MKSKKGYRNSQKLSKKVNKRRIGNVIKFVKLFLITLLFVTIVTCIISNGLVTTKELAILKLHNETNKIFMDNNDNNINVEFAKSIYTVNTKATSINKLHKPDKIIEIHYKTPDVSIELDKLPKNSRVRVVGGY